MFQLFLRVQLFRLLLPVKTIVGLFYSHILKGFISLFHIQVFAPQKVHSKYIQQIVVQELLVRVNP